MWEMVKCQFFVSIYEKQDSISIAIKISNFQEPDC